jgi:hypothetical protein
MEHKISENKDFVTHKVKKCDMGQFLLKYLLQQSNKHVRKGK